MQHQPNISALPNRPMKLLFNIMLLALFAALSNPLHANGNWTKKSFSIKGGWSIVEQNGSRVLTLDQRFKTRKAPDLKIFLSKKPLSELNGDNATTESVLISPLKSNKGAQQYVLPANVDISQYKSLIIHCEAYSKLWGGASL
jgi:hypothetical protein